MNNSFISDTLNKLRDNGFTVRARHHKDALGQYDGCTTIVAQKGRVRVIGFAQCSEEDRPEKAVGLRIAFRRFFNDFSAKFPDRDERLAMTRVGVVK